jgi:TetR/AcrR family transcriptional repressor of nem operon
MRYPAEHKEQVRRQIVRAAARRFRGRGSERVPIAQLMRDLRLTHGGFYRHFTGKEQLFDEALAESFAQVRARLLEAVERAAPGHELEAIIRTYLSEQHCANIAEGCPVAALATETARHRKRARTTFDEGIREQVAAFLAFMPGATTADRERMALVLFGGMAGVLNLARATSDEKLRRTVLEGGRAFYVRALCPAS